MKNNLTFSELKDSLVNLPESLRFTELYIPNLKYTVDILINGIEVVPEDFRKRSAVCQANKHLLQRIYKEINK